MDTSTREKILKAMCQLLVTRGYRGTSTRDIADLVGIRQPSLFHHFESKRAIMVELLERDLRPATARARYFRRRSGSPAARLYAYLVADMRTLDEASSSIYTSRVLDEPDFTEYRHMFNELAAFGRDVIQEGVTAGQLRQVRPELAQRAIIGMFYAAMLPPGLSGARMQPDWPWESAEFILRGLLKRPSTFATIRREADAMLADLAAESTENRVLDTADPSNSSPGRS